jgi:hypothetical protein
MYNQTPDLSKMPEGASHWAAETDDHMEAWYKHDGQSWSCLNTYWAAENPNSWYGLGTSLKRPMTDLIKI